MNEEGVIKFNCTWIKQAPLNVELIKELNIWRDKLYKLKLLGATKDGIGYGNISCRYKEHFIISGSGTGKLKHLTNEHYATVTNYSVQENTLTAVGPVIASSESLTHAVIYKSQPTINAVFHVHHFALWKKLLNKIATTHIDVAYGTPAMANEIVRLFEETDLASKKIFVMAGHEEGIVSFGKDVSEAGHLLLDALRAL
jgi:ribulose-5-phosphate 4-epimerase/fuculose-1-phosphate aldolase